MRLIVTLCRCCGQVTDAHHAETIEDLLRIGEFIRIHRALGRQLSQLTYREEEGPLHWCKCEDPQH